MEPNEKVHTFLDEVERKAAALRRELDISWLAQTTGEKAMSELLDGVVKARFSLGGRPHALSD